MQKIKIGFWGSPYIAGIFLEDLLKDERFNVLFVVTQPDKARSKRGRQVQPSFVKKIALKNNIPVMTPISLKKEKNDLLQEMKQYNIDFNVILSYGKIIPEELFNHPPLKSLNFHGSILPKLRGPSPIQSAIMQGHHQTGWSLQLLANEMDAGDLLFTNTIPIEWNDDSDSLFQKMTENLLVIGRDLLFQYYSGELNKTQQNEDDITFCYKFKSDLSLIDWKQNVLELRNLARTLSFKPGMYTSFNNKKIKIFFDFDVPEDKILIEHKAKLGSVYSIDKNHLWISCNGGILPVSHLQLEGKKKLAISDFLNGYNIKLNDTFQN